MEAGTVRHELDPRGPPAGASRAGTELTSYMAADLADLLTKRRESEDLAARTAQRQQVLVSLQRRIKELQKNFEEAEELSHSFYKFIKHVHTNRVTEKAAREREVALENEREIKRLKEQYAKLMERKHKLQRRVQRLTLYGDLMSNVVKMTKFEEVQAFIIHLENLLHLRDQLCEKENADQEEVDQLRKALQTQEEQRHLLWLHTNNQLSQLHGKLDKACSEAHTWESKWNRIVQTVAKKSLLLVRIKMVSLQLYELTDDKVEEEGVKLNNTEKQLEKVKMFIQSYSHAWTQLGMEHKGKK